ncbi:MAG: LLM class flavin-dependent oxidoreductase [Acidobacteriaceae bacterium]|nr:LLM class flavin-dependent oxidoreductase [Acidobacteriaceae bacterium]
MKFGIHYQLPCYGSQSPVQRYRDTLEQSVHAETLGFESVWPVEQHFNAELSITPAPLLLLAALAERTRSIRLGIAIVLVPLSHPLRIAEEIATLDVLSNGRVEFGVGRGAIPIHFTTFGVPQSESRERFAESLELILKAWTHERVSHDGRFFNIRDIPVVPKPVQRPYPLVRVAANSIDTFELMGHEGYPIFVATPINPFAKIPGNVALYREARRAAGHPDNIGEDVTLALPLHVGDSAAQVRELMEPSIRHYLQTVASIYEASTAQNAGNRTVREQLDRLRSVNYEQACATMALFDTPEVCVDRLHEMQEQLKIGRVICWFNIGGGVPHSKVMRSMELFAARVMPHFQ